jgi:hypothetical protein
MSRVRVTEAHVASLADTLSPREHAIVATLDRLRIASATQLSRLHFIDAGTPRTAARRTRRTLHRLVSRRVILRLDRRIGGPGAGSADYVYALDVAGQRLASACGPAGGARIRRPWTPGVSFLRHGLAVSELYVRLWEAEIAGGLDLLDFDAEPLCWRTFTGIGGARLALKPDAFLRLGIGDYEAFYFIEVDRATQSRPAITRKLTRYRRYHQTGREQKRFGVFPKVLLLVPSERRKAALVDLAAAQPAASWELFQVARYDHAVAVLTGALA